VLGGLIHEYYAAAAQCEIGPSRGLRRSANPSRRTVTMPPVPPLAWIRGGLQCGSTRSEFWIPKHENSWRLVSL
jgi:hypothetical protein